jgi:hypothetical protein
LEIFNVSKPRTTTRTFKAITIGAAITAAVILLPTGAAQAERVDCKKPASFNRDVKNDNAKQTRYGNIWGSQVAFFSANTNAGNGNGGETANWLTNTCLVNIPTDDTSIQNGNAFDPAGFFDNRATDPGNSGVVGDS